MHVAGYLIDSGRRTVELYAAFLGLVDQLEVLDERLDAVDAAPSGRTAPMLRELLG